MAKVKQACRELHGHVSCLIWLCFAGMRFFFFNILLLSLIQFKISCRFFSWNSKTIFKNLSYVINIFNTRTAGPGLFLVQSCKVYSVMINSFTLSLWLNVYFYKGGWSQLRVKMRETGLRERTSRACKETYTMKKPKKQMNESMIQNTYIKYI